MSRWSGAGLAAVVLIAALLGVGPASGHPGHHDKKLFTGRWWQEVIGGDYDEWMTLSTSQVWLECDGSELLCGNKWSTPFTSGIDDWNSKRTTVVHAVAGDQSLNYDVNVFIKDEALPAQFLLGIDIVYDLNYDECDHDGCTFFYEWILVGDDAHSDGYATAEEREATISHELGHGLSLKHESVNADESVQYGCGKDDTGVIPHSIMAYSCIDPAPDGRQETYVHDWDVCGVNHAYYDPNWGFALCGPVGGIAELPEEARAVLEAPDSSSTNTVLASVAGALVAALFAMSGAAWYARRRLS